MSENLSSRDVIGKLGKNLHLTLNNGTVRLFSILKTFNIKDSTKLSTTLTGPKEARAIYRNMSTYLQKSLRRF